ncbi:MAG: peptidoglycan recognition protein family protein [Turicibacter sp.]
MAYVYKQAHLERTAHNLKYKYGRSFTPTQITYHQTSNKASAKNERDYLNNRKDAVYIGFHLVVDDKEAIECLPLTVQTWHSGDGYGDGNMKSIGIEIAYSTSPDIALRDAAIINGAQLIASLMVKFNISMANVLPHQARSGKYCPHDILGRYGHDKFRSLIEAEYNKLIKPTAPTIKPDAPMTFAQYDKVLLTAPTNGYMSSTETKTAAKVLSPGEYRVYKYAKGARHEVNVSATGKSPDVWIDVSAIKKASIGAPGDRVILRSDTLGYTSSSDTKPTTTLKSGTYYIYKYVLNAPHAVNISQDETKPGAWVDESSIEMM